MIEQKDFDKLKQSDRIELLLRKTRLEDRYKWYNIFDSFFVIFFMMILFFISIGLLDLVTKLTYIFLGYVILMTIINFINQVLEAKKTKELESYFFKKEVKPKR